MTVVQRSPYAGMTGWWGGIGDGQPQGLPVRWAGRGLFSEESFMSAAAGTTKHESGSRAIRESPLREDDRRMDSRPVSWYGVTFFRGNDEVAVYVSRDHTKSEQLPRIKYSGPADAGESTALKMRHIGFRPRRLVIESIQAKRGCTSAIHDKAAGGDTRSICQVSGTGEARRVLPCSDHHRWSGQPRLKIRGHPS